MATRSAIINVMTAAAHKAGRRIIRDFGEVEHLQISRKGPADFVSEADRRAEKTLREALQRARPDYSFLAEEGGEIVGKDTSHRWIIDPIDGTTNFLHGIPHWAVSVGLEREGELYAGVIYDPLRDEMFWAERGLGAYVNETRIRVSARQQMADCVFATGIPFKGRDGHEEFLAVMPAIMQETAGVRRFGAASLDLAFVAAGRYDGFWEFGLSPWDVAAGIVIVREAGGLVGEISGRANMLHGGSILATNSNMYDPLGKMLRKALKAADIAKK